MALNTLNDEQKNKLNQFQTITEIKDIEEALGHLIEYEWNLERAIQHIYENNNSNEKREQLEEEVASSSSRHCATPPSTPPFIRNNMSSRMNNRTMTNRPSLLLSILFWPFGIAWNITWSILSFASRLIYRPAITSNNNNNRKRDPRVLAAEFIELFEFKYGPRHIDFFKGGYSQALEKARKDLRFMLVLLQSNDHDDTENFCRNILTSNTLIEFIKEKQILVWAGDVHESEAHKVSYTLQATTYPFMALIALKTPPGSSAAKMSVIERLEGYQDVDELISQIEMAIERHGAVMNRLKHEREQRELERQLRVDQDKAYRESLKMDQEKARKAQEAKEMEERMKREKELEAQRLSLLKQKRTDYIHYLYAQLPDEPSNTEKVAKLSFRLADGDRVVRQFPHDATIETLYRFVEVYPLMKEGIEKQDIKEPPSDYTHEYKFTIHSPYPRMEYLPDDTKTLFEIKNLWPSATLVVDAVDDDEEEEN
ncbi:uncharacterized protein BX663DRAFT_520214 [Cokeromyces recurvatus]|uniref:uncharacterized protein n=1 Tax=Cokeromyces recurvatus TaxID=90255 RepID=UPI002220347F|nr:uncharacterized protein BX663DRAFT_520214 [Cokeromyces recurvatus]KAI7899724.1 hypothetical protein BX663DRAFT_520214 [Cokeromyces recurvatus]